jgi:hypothetical protein
VSEADQPLIVRLRARPRGERAAYLEGYLSGLRKAAEWDHEATKARTERLNSHLALVQAIVEEASK